MSNLNPGRTGRFNTAVSILVLCLALLCLSAFHPQGSGDQAFDAANKGWTSDHFDGEYFFNPGARKPPPRKNLGWLVRFLTGQDWSTWPRKSSGVQVRTPVIRAPQGSTIVTSVGHGTFLIQQDGLNILTDPIWSERCSPVTWAGPKRHRAPGIRFEDLPPIDAVLVSHNHYDHLDVPTLKRLAKAGVQRSITPLGNRELISSTGIPAVYEIDWWQSVPISKDVSVTLVPAQHYSSRRPWDRNRTLWGGFVISGPSGNVYYSGDTGYGPHFREIARRFSPVKMALLPISPFRPPHSNEPSYRHNPIVHMGPEDAVQAHLDLGTRVSIAAHFQVFQLGADGFDDAPVALKSVLERRKLQSESFIAPVPGHRVQLTARPVL